MHGRWVVASKCPFLFIQFELLGCGHSCAQFCHLFYSSMKAHCDCTSHMLLSSYFIFHIFWTWSIAKLERSKSKPTSNDLFRTACSCLQIIWFWKGFIVWLITRQAGSVSQSGQHTDNFSREHPHSTGSLFCTGLAPSFLSLYSQGHSGDSFVHFIVWEIPELLILFVSNMVLCDVFASGFTKKSMAF